MQLSSSIKSISKLNNLIGNVRTIDGIFVPTKEYILIDLANAKKINLLMQLVPFTDKVVQNIKNYINTHLVAYDSINERCTTTRKVYDRYKNLTEDAFVNDSYEKIEAIKKQMSIIGNEINELSKVMVFDHENSKKIFDTVQERNDIDDDFAIVINEKFKFNMAGIDDKETSILETMLLMLKNNMT